MANISEAPGSSLTTERSEGRKKGQRERERKRKIKITFITITPDFLRKVRKNKFFLVNITFNNFNSQCNILIANDIISKSCFLDICSFY